jgi:hypothetical protein
LAPRRCMRPAHRRWVREPFQSLESSNACEQCDGINLTGIDAVTSAKSETLSHTHDVAETGDGCPGYLTFVYDAGRTENSTTAQSRERRRQLRSRATTNRSSSEFRHAGDHVLDGSSCEGFRMSGRQSNPCGAPKIPSRRHTVRQTAERSANGAGFSGSCSTSAAPRDSKCQKGWEMLAVSG